MKMKFNYLVRLFLMICFVPFSYVNASNKVTIATIGGRVTSVSVGDNHNPQKIVVQELEHWKKELNKVLPNKPDLILLPEDCDLPGELTTEEKIKYYQVRKNQVLDFFATAAKANHCYIAFGMNREENGAWRNSCILLDREGKVAGIYNKNFPTIDEMQMIKAGNESQVFQCDFGRIACVICFDLNFDELLKKYEVQNPDIILFPSMYHGGYKQIKWANTCRSFFVCACGFLVAPSEIRNPLGEVVASSTNYFNYAVATVNLDRKLVHLDNNWEKLDALKRKYGKEVTITDPGKLGAVMISSEKLGVSAAEMVREFNMELVEEYFDRSRQVRLKQLGL